MTSHLVLVLRVTLDSGAYISALQFNDGAVRLLRVSADNDIEIATSEAIISEVIYPVPCRVREYNGLC
jgi:predicted nucleic acid-binding protein